MFHPICSTLFSGLWMSLLGKVIALLLLCNVKQWAICKDFSLCQNAHILYIYIYNFFYFFFFTVTSNPRVSMIFLRVQPWPKACKITRDRKKSHNLKHSCGLLNYVFGVYIGLSRSGHCFIKVERCRGGLNRVSGRITDRVTAEGNYCYFTIKLYTQGGITPDRAEHSSTPDVCVCVYMCEWVWNLIHLPRPLRLFWQVGECRKRIGRREN